MTGSVEDYAPTGSGTVHQGSNRRNPVLSSCSSEQDELVHEQHSAVPLAIDSDEYRAEDAAIEAICSPRAEPLPIRARNRTTSTGASLSKHDRRVRPSLDGDNESIDYESEAEAASSSAASHHGSHGAGLLRRGSTRSRASHGSIAGGRGSTVHGSIARVDDIGDLVSLAHVSSPSSTTKLLQASPSRGQ